MAKNTSKLKDKWGEGTELAMRLTPVKEVVQDGIERCLDAVVTSRDHSQILAQMTRDGVTDDQYTAAQMIFGATLGIYNMVDSTSPKGLFRRKKSHSAELKEATLKVVAIAYALKESKLV